MYVLRDRLGALSTRLTLHGLIGQNLPHKPRCVYSHPEASVHIIGTAGSLHRAFSDGIGESLIEIKLKTQDDHLRTCLSELKSAALEKYYHRTCLRSAQRTFTPVFHRNIQVIRTVCGEQLFLSIQTTLD